MAILSAESSRGYKEPPRNLGGDIVADLEKYSGLKFMTPHQPQSGQTDQVVDNRKAVYDAARATNPKRWA
jgi:hypothetical protein